MFEKDTLNLERQMVRQRVLAQERPYRTAERDPMPEHPILSDEEVIRQREQEAVRGSSTDTERDRRLKSQETELVQKRTYEQEREKRLMERERELAQKRRYEQERELRMQSRDQELYQKRGTHTGYMAAATYSATDSDSSRDYAAEWEQSKSKGRGRRSGKVAVPQESVPSYDRMAAQDRLMAQKRVVDEERARMNRERTLDRGHGLYMDRSLNRKRAAIPEYETNRDMDPAITWQGGMDGLREMMANNKMLITFLAVLAGALLLMILLMIVRGA